MRPMLATNWDINSARASRSRKVGRGIGIRGTPILLPGFAETQTKSKQTQLIFANLKPSYAFNWAAKRGVASAALHIYN